MNKKNVFPDVEDYFFKKGHILLKTYQIAVTVLSWICVIIPFIWIYLSLYTSHSWFKIKFYSFEVEYTTLHSISLFLVVYSIFIITHHILMSIRINYATKKLNNRNDNEFKNRIENKSEEFDNIFSHKFGEKRFRYNVRYYSINEDKIFLQNLSSVSLNERIKK